MSIEMLSPKQKETAETIFKLTQQEHFPPTLDEIAAQMGITKGTLQYHISALKKKNIITWNQGSARSIRIIDDDSYNYCRDKFSTETDSQTIHKFDHVHNAVTNSSFSRASNGKMYRDNESESDQLQHPMV